jgi:large subunit ribosomal protein L10
MISDFAEVGIKTKVTDAKLERIKDTIVAGKGSIIDENKANILKKIDVRSVKVGLTPIAVYDNGTTFTADQLQIDTADYINKLGLAHTQAFNLSIEAAIPVKDNIETLLAKAHNEAFNLAIEASIAVKEVIDKLLSIGTSQAKALAEAIKNKYEVNQ